MPSPAPVRDPAGSPDELHRRRLDAINSADIDGYLDVHDDEVAVIVPPDGRTAHGRDEIRRAIAPLFALHPAMTTTTVSRLETDEFALTHHRWHLTLTEHGCRADIGGLGTTIARRRGDGTWRIVLDDPFTGA